MAKRAAGASNAHVAQVARAALVRGNAVEAVVAGILAAVAESPSVLLGPLQMLVGGAGAGLLAVDGRVRQPGLGVPRPRGLLAGEAVPPQARVGVPALPVALAAVLASSGGGVLTKVAGPAVESARAISPERADVIEAVARYGATALAHESLVTELLAAAGRAAGGALTREDLHAVRPVLVSCDEGALAAGILSPPWRSGEAEGPLDASTTQVVAAADGRGLVVVACYDAPLEGLPIPALGLLAPAFAAPVMRGEPRVRPGDARPAPAPIALRAGRGLINLALGMAQEAGAEDKLRMVLHALDAPTIAEALAAAPAARPVAIVRTREAAVVMASA